MNLDDSTVHSKVLVYYELIPLHSTPLYSTPCHFTSLYLVHTGGPVPLPPPADVRGWGGMDIGGDQLYATQVGRLFDIFLVII